VLSIRAMMLWTMLWFNMCNGQIYGSCEKLTSLSALYGPRFSYVPADACRPSDSIMGGTQINAIPNEYIVVMRDNRTHVSTQTRYGTTHKLRSTLLQHHTTGPTDNTFVASIKQTYVNVFNGFSAFLSPTAVELVLEDPDVLFVEYDAMVSAHISQKDPIWNLDRIDRRYLTICIIQAI
jgi:hypothetical protein